MTDQAAHAREQAREQAARGPSFFASRSLRLMLAVTIIGLGLWVYALITRPPQAPAPVGSNAAGYAAGIAPNAQPPGKPRLIDESAPATFRFGLSFVVGFFVAWVFRRVIKLTLLVAGGIAVLLIVLKQTGVVDLNFDAVQEQVNHGVEVAQQNASRAKDFILGYLPSGASAATGLFFGARRRV